MSSIEGPRKAADLFVEALLNENISHIFALPGVHSKTKDASFRSKISYSPGQSVSQFMGRWALINQMWSMTGEENLDLVESLRTSKIVLHIVRHEQAAGFMAATVGRLTGTRDSLRNTA